MRQRLSVLADVLVYTAITRVYCTLCVVVDVSAKVAEVYEITPQTQYVLAHSNGRCVWYPRFELSQTHCKVDVTWFPFDTQSCHLVFESWMLDANEINITINDDVDILSKYIPTDEWDLTCVYGLTML